MNLRHGMKENMKFYTDPEVDDSVWIPDIYLYNMGPAELDDRELGYIDLLCSALFFLLDSCFLLFLSSFFSFFLVPSSSILAHLGSILGHLGSSWLPKPPPKLLRKKVTRM